jgi:hypothetical protein
LSGSSGDSLSAIVLDSQKVVVLQIDCYSAQNFIGFDVRRIVWNYDAPPNTEATRHIRWAQTECFSCKTEIRQSVRSSTGPAQSTLPVRARTAEHLSG